MKKICLLGSTGSIGSQTIELINENPRDFSLVAVSCGQNIELFRKILMNNKEIKWACVQLEKDYLLLKEEFKEIIKKHNEKPVVSDDNIIIGFIKEYWLYLLIGIVVILVPTITYIVIKNKRRVKIDI